MVDTDDVALARRYTPIIAFDRAEPFLPVYIGYTIFHTSGASPSFPRYVRVEQPATLAIEYAIWWDWDIQHVYELEHAWVFVDGSGSIVGVESSQHGAASGAPRVATERPVLYAEPGKHALRSTTTELLAAKPGTERSCGVHAGVGGVWVTPLYRGRIQKTPDADQLVRTFLRQQAFAPAWQWDRQVDLAELPLIPWPLLDMTIPGIVAERIAELDAAIPRYERHVLRIGHHGAGIHAPANTLAAIARAAELGADMVELDVRVTADGVAVLAHDAIVELNQPGGEELQPNAEQAAPTLVEALDLCADLGLGSYLELKDGAAIDATVSELAWRDIRRHTIVGSFNPAWVARVTDRMPQLATSILFSAFDTDPVAAARACGARYVHPCWERHPAPHTLLKADWLAAVRRSGFGILTWHEERPDVIDALRAMGVSGICSDRLDILKARV